MVMYWANEQNGLIAVSAIDPVDLDSETTVYIPDRLTTSGERFNSDSQGELMEKLSDYADGEWIICTDLMAALRIAESRKERVSSGWFSASFLIADGFINMCVSGRETKAFFNPDTFADALEILYRAVERFGADVDSWPSEHHEFREFKPDFSGIYRGQVVEL